MPMWLDFQKEQVNMLGFEKWDKPVLRYRVHAGNYINNNLGKLKCIKWRIENCHKSHELLFNSGI
jgi:Tfp pilus assembly protein PilP